MTRGLLRTVATLLLIAGAVFSFCPTVVAALTEPAATDACCGGDRNEPDRPDRAGDCAPAECGCVTCVVGIQSTLAVALQPLACGPLPVHREVLQPPSGYLATIDYPPEAV